MAPKLEQETMVGEPTKYYFLKSGRIIDNIINVKFI